MPGARYGWSSTAAPATRATTRSSPRPGSRTRRWSGCGWRAPGTCTCRCAIRSMIPERVAAALAGAQRPVCAYVYDTTVLRARAAAVRAVLPPDAALLYAVKANGHPAVVAALAAATDGLAVASGGELALARRYTDRIAFSGPGKTPAELDAAVAAGATVNVESVLEARRIAALDRPVRV